MSTQELTIEATLEAIRRDLGRVMNQQSDMMRSMRGKKPAHARISLPRDSDFLRATEFFEDACDAAVALARNVGTMRILNPGERLFSAGEPCDSIYIIKVGVIEILRPSEDERIAPACYLGAGDVIGKVGVFSDGDHRSSACAPEGATVFEIGREDFADILECDTGLAVKLCRLLSRRLEGVAAHLDVVSTGRRQLQGKLRYFDLATVVQSLVSDNDHTGILCLTNIRDEEIGRITIRHGSIISATCGSLFGSAAFEDLFAQDMSEAAFTYVEMSADEDLGAEDDSAKIPDMTLLMDAARIRDECERLLNERFLEGRAILSRAHDGALVWKIAASKAAATDLWELLAEKPRRLRDVLGHAERSRCEVLSTLAAMVDARQLDIFHP